MQLGALYVNPGDLAASAIIIIGFIAAILIVKANKAGYEAGYDDGFADGSEASDIACLKSYEDACRDAGKCA